MDIEKRYYTIGEVAKKLGVTTSLIRFWEGQFPEVSPRKNKNGVRQYTRQDIEILETIYHLVKEKGYTLSGAKDMLKEKPQMNDTVELINSLEKIKAFLQDLKAKVDSK